MAEQRVWVWLNKDYDIQHLASAPDATQMAWEGETVCELSGDLRRVTFENIDGGTSCRACSAEPYALAGDDRGPP